jgi:hypothetical protein
MAEKKFNFSKKVGSLLVVMLDSRTRLYIAEVIQEDPLRVKVTEKGPYAKMRDSEILIFESETERIQSDEKRRELFKEYADRKFPLISGLKCLNAPNDGKFYEILPAPLEEIKTA